MGDGPGRYWDYRECRWVVAEQRTRDVALPAQARPADGEPAAAAPAITPAVGADQGADVRSE